MSDIEIFVYPKNIYVLDTENDSLYISGFSSEAEANETAKCIGARVVNYIREEAAQIAISELEEEVKRLNNTIDFMRKEREVRDLEQQAKGCFSAICDVKGKSIDGNEYILMRDINNYGTRKMMKAKELKS